MSSENKTENNLTELAFAVLLLAVLALLTANILVFVIASQHNDEICRSVTIAAAKSAVAGEDKKAVYVAAWQELTQGGYGGFFIDAPKILKFTDITKNNLRRIRVQTQCMARLPVRNLIVSNDIKNGLILRRTYVVEIGLTPETPKSSEPVRTNDDKEDKDDSSEQ